MEIYVLFNDDNCAEAWGITRRLAIKKYLDTFDDEELDGLDFLDCMHFEAMTRKEFNSLPED